ncbi:hypothetical protein EDD32_3729 [Georgenia muralis]|uniref:Uncharacterized protein n=1 Tax=Georgenia muralis TaxID=154117 RepID=A0A3N4ZUS4_9MICO|nr:hypothetical protein EDD32_3729 [Georgenia muralis]
MSAVGAADRSGHPGVRSLPPAAVAPVSLGLGNLEPGGLELLAPDPDAGWCTDGVCLPAAGPSDR